MNIALSPLFAATAALLVLPTSSVRANDAARLARRVALVAELLDEGASAEASVEAARLRADMPEVADAALAPLAAALAQAGATPASPAAPASRGGVGGWLARRVVWFYRTFVGTAIGDRCVLQPSCSRYFLEASRRHGLLGIPMITDRFVREPAASAPDRPWVRMPSGEWRHPDPVEDHDFWFSKTGDSQR